MIGYFGSGIYFGGPFFELFRVILGPHGGIFGVFLDFGVFLVILQYYWQYFLFF